MSETDDIQTLLIMARDEHGDEVEWEQIRDRWRAARGEDAFDDWAWWWRIDGGEGYESSQSTRDKALEEALREYPGESVELIEACMWNDEIDAEDDVMPFARSRNHETVELLA